MTIASILVTGFEPYGGHSRNPAFEAMRALDGRIIDGVPIRGRGLPVSMTRLKPALAALFDEAEFAAIISLGLQPGASVIQIERSASNLADFEIADNDGLSFRDASVSANGPAARLATLPLRAIERALLAAGIPAQLSASAGTFLCNACLYCCLEAVEAHPRPPLCGFVHLPCLPEQVAEAALKQERPGPAVASMELSRIVVGVEIAVRETIRALARSDYETASKKTALP